MLPIVIPEKLTSLFKYWCQDIRFGMFYGNELYTQVSVYAPDKRMAAYDDAYRLSEAGSLVCITVAPTGYTLWQSLRSFSASTFEVASIK